MPTQGSTTPINVGKRNNRTTPPIITGAKVTGNFDVAALNAIQMRDDLWDQYLRCTHLCGVLGITFGENGEVVGYTPPKVHKAA